MIEASLAIVVVLIILMGAIWKSTEGGDDD